MLDCGTCTAPDSCDGAGTANVCGCTPTTCAALDKNCGAVADGCGGSLDCGTCTGYDTCDGSGVANICGCTPHCGACCGGPNGCGGTCAPLPCCNIGCFVAGTMITMADGTLEPIERVRAGERVRAYDVTSDAFAAAEVSEVVQHEPEASRDGIVLVNGTLRVTTNHPIWVDGRRVRADELELGSTLLLPGERDADGRVERRRDQVWSLQLLEGRVPTFDLRVGAPGTYVANGIVVFLKD
jgi:hypothetical protein